MPLKKSFQKVDVRETVNLKKAPWTFLSSYPGNGNLESSKKSPGKKYFSKNFLKILVLMKFFILALWKKPAQSSDKSDMLLSACGFEPSYRISEILFCSETF